MKKYNASILIVGLTYLYVPVFGQTDPMLKAFADLKDQIIQTDSTESMLLTPTGFNMFLQQKSMLFLTGNSDLALAKLYGTYSTDNDKLNIGFNVPITKNKYTQHLRWIINPVLEADLKKNMSKLYEDDKWKNNIRGGLKITYMLPFKTLNFWGERSDHFRKPDLIFLRSRKYEELRKKNEEEFKKKLATVQLLHGQSIAPGKAITIGSRTLPAVPLPEPTKKELKSAKQELYKSIGSAEVEYLEKEKGTYTWLQSGWISIWAYSPLTRTDQYISLNSSEPFQKVKFELWEVNFQLNYLLDSKSLGTLYGAASGKIFQNNSAHSNLMTSVDYNQYSQFPGSNPLNYALLQSDKAFIGDYEEFVTKSVSIQLVYMTPWAYVVKPGISFRYEKNWGTYSPKNLTYGLPISIQGKEKPFNIEIQYILRDVDNYAEKADHKRKETFGISVGLPVALLYK